MNYSRVRFILSTNPEGEGSKCQDLASANLSVRQIRDDGQNPLRRFIPRSIHSTAIGTV